MITVAVFATNWDGSRFLNAQIYPSADGVDLKDTPGIADTFTVPDNATQVTIKAVPYSPDWWGVTATLAVAQNGSLTLSDRGDALAVTIEQAPGALSSQFAKIVIRLSRVKLATKDIVDALDRVPPPASQLANTWLTQYTNYARDRAVRLLNGGTSPVLAQGLMLPRLSGLATLNLAPPVYHFKDDTRGGDLLQFATRDIELHNRTFVVAVAGDSIVPRTIAVSWPDDVPRDQPAPMLVYYRHTPAQETDFLYGKFDNPSLEPYPFSFDYAYFGLLTTLWYENSPDEHKQYSQGVADQQDSQEMTDQQYSQGVAYQVEAAGKKVVTVVACPIATPNKGSTQFGEWTSPDFMESVLLEIQALAAVSGTPSLAPPSELGRVAIAAFSSAHWHMSQLLIRPGHPFLTQTVKECYLIDPKEDVLREIVPRLLAWEANVERVAPGQARIRLYNSDWFPQQKDLIANLPPKTPFITASTSGRRTVAIATNVDWGRSVTAFHHDPLSAAESWTWPAQHFALAAFMLTHALAESGF
jgi:hypothetical protein